MAEIEYLFIDGSYFIFQRYHALQIWWKHAQKDGDLDKQDPFENEEFVEKYKSTFKSKIKELIKKLKLKSPKIIVGKDCKRKDIWRMKLLDSYKASRSDNKFIGNFFSMVYEENLFIDSGASMILSYDNLEADDCIALASKFILNNSNSVSDVKITIITNDCDYLQLASDSIDIVNMQFKSIKCKINETPEKSLFFKIVIGDKSDNIPGVFKKCGVKTCEKYYNDKDLFNKQLEKENAFEKFMLNKTLIDFNMIPENLVNGVYNKYGGEILE